MIKDEAKEKEVIIVTYYWPPAGGGGVQRWVKFVKYLNRLGWSPIVVCPANASYPLRDLSLESEIPEGVEIIKVPIFEPRKVIEKLSRGKEEKSTQKLDQLFYRKNKSWAEKIIIWIRSNLFIPDARKFWIKPLVKELSKLIEERSISKIITTGTPHSVHIAGLTIKKKYNIKWVADFRDPWTDIEYFDHMPLLESVRKKHFKLQNAVLNSADHVITVSPSWKKLFESYGAKKVTTITNGFDSEDFVDLEVDEKNNFFKIVHAGTLAQDRYPNALIDALKTLKETNFTFFERIRIEFYGHTDEMVIDKIIQEIGAKAIINHGYVSHNKAIKAMFSSDLLLLIMNHTNKANEVGRIPGKVFEYIASEKPILMIGEANSDLGRIIHTLNRSKVIGFDEKAKMFEFINTFSETESNENRGGVSLYSKTQFDRIELTKKLISVLETL